MSTDTILRYEVLDGVARLTLNRPETRNALDLDLREEIGRAVVAARDDADVKAVVITGAGGAFCAGGDLRSLSAERRGAVANRHRVRRLHHWFEQLVNLEKPVVAAVDGPAFGAGFNLALAADFILCTPRARFCAVFERIGLVPDLGGFFLLPRIVGLQKAKDIVLTARVVGAEEAKTLGIAYGIIPEGELQDTALAFAGRFRHASTDAIGMAKTILNQSFHLDQRALADLEAYAQAVAIESDHHRDAVATFLGKRPLPFDWDAMTEQVAGQDAKENKP
ncbi:enoyl-CoA hydratase/isomerase family protein [Azospirillum sp.]|uniref:enoyl-CoA hydratase/isomerase family protein n=1 Tax=Azospirillum sp. TaxID=34012 RepID=UPI002D34EEA5|nr:enoyl-CoA hydratase/isomerase family protein [Azospirillum sp.]HYD71127.1 enoyl-CoA hydratase/isomerase family protein [Azospirillum sp.]HYH23201.1 enoyl-CoA hydratase/isomerase family protein [Azospirillum sp.]